MQKWPWVWIAVATFAVVIPASFFAGMYARDLHALKGSRHVERWMPLTIGQPCVGYGGVNPPSVSLPEPVECDGRFRVLERSSPTIGFEFTIDIPSADSNDIPQAWREDRSVGEWTYEGETQIPYAGHIEFVFLDEHGFEVTTRDSAEVQVRSGERKEVRAVLTGFDPQELELISSANAQLLMTHCFLCSPPQE